jgi:hypothetical protein
MSLETELKLAPSYVNEAGEIITIADETDWCDYGRENYALFFTASEQSVAGPSNSLEIAEQLLLTTVSSWDVETLTDGKYNFNLYVFNTQVVGEPVEDEVIFNSTTKVFSQWDGNSWVIIETSVALQFAAFTKTLTIPILFRSREYKTDLILKYVENSTSTDHSHKDKNRSFYERSELDHFNALLIAAGYSFELSLFANFYDLLKLLNELIASNTK